MTKTYKLFKTYCIIAIAVFCVLLFAVGICTAKYQTDKAVFKATYSTARIFSSENNITVNLGGKIISFDPQSVNENLERIRAVLLIPINNIIEFVRNAAYLINR